MADVILPGTEAQRKRAVLQIARQVRKAYRAADTAGEVLERWLDRQISRKTRIMPKSVNTGVRLFRAYWDRVRLLEQYMSDFAYIAASS